MYGWLRKKAPHASNNGLSTILALDEKQFASAVSETVSQSGQAECAMLIVALYNFAPVEKVMNEVMHRERKTFDEEDFLRQTLAKDMSHPINGRRLGWFALAMLIRRLDRLAVKDPILALAASQTWASLIEGAQRVPELLVHNIVWKSEEKTFVLASMAPGDVSTPSSHDAMLFVLRRMLPKGYRDFPAVKAVQKHYGLSFFGP